MQCKALKKVCIVAFACFVADVFASVDDTLRPIAGYKPQNDLSDLLSLDLDQEAMEARLLANSDAGLQDALEFYSRGAHSMSIATVRLALPLSQPLKAGIVVIGEDDYNHEVVGTVYENALVDDAALKFKYTLVQNTTRFCRVGTLRVGKQDVHGCLTRENTINVPSTGAMLAYTYDPYTDNDNGRTLQSLSLDANTKFYECKNCPYETFLKYRVYFGKSTYANEWITAAFEGRKTDFKNGHSNFESLSLVGRSEAIKKGTILLTTWMHVVGLLDDAVAVCQPMCPYCAEHAVRSWDEAVALYTGSLKGADGTGQGVFLYDHADMTCASFRTCGPSHDLASGRSAVNLEVFDLFQSGQLDISNGQCDAARVKRERIIQLMTIPLIQGALLYAHRRDKQNSDEEVVAGTAVYAASILPLIYSCSPTDAISVWEMMAVGSSTTNFIKVKAALERNYGCLVISCVDVGGVYDSSSGSFYEDASPCTHDGSLNNSAAPQNYGMILGIVVGAVFGILVVMCCCPLRLKNVVKKVADIPDLEESHVEQKPHNYQQPDGKCQRQLVEVGRMAPSKSPPKTGNEHDPQAETFSSTTDNAEKVHHSLV